MAGLNNIFEIGKSALAASQSALNTTGQNIANANTEGYSRKVTNFEASVNYLGGGLQIGSGVTVNEVTRVRNRFIDSQLSLQRQTLSYWSTMESKHLLIEQIYEEPGETGLSSIMNSFFESWSELANAPENSSLRENVIYQGDALVKKFNSLNERLTDMENELTDEISDEIEKFNDYAQQITEINSKLLYVDKRSGSYSSLLDNRDVLLEKMNEIADITIQENDDGQVNLSLNGKVFLQKTHFIQLDSSKIDGDMAEMNWSDGTTSATAQGGKLGALIDLRENIIPENIEKLDNLASAIVDTINTQHKAGYGYDGSTGVVFFDVNSVDANTIALNSSLYTNNQLLATSSDGEAGSGGNALLMSQLQDSKVLADNTATFTDYYSEIVATEGNRREEAITLYEGQEIFTDNLYSYQQSITGVSLDEEMTDLLKYQRSYQAASKLITLADEISETLINMV